MTLYAPTSFVRYPKTEEITPRAYLRGDYVEDAVKNQTYAFDCPQMLIADMNNAAYIDSETSYVEMGLYPVRMPQIEDQAGTSTVTLKWAARMLSNAGTRNTDVRIVRYDGADNVLDTQTIAATTTPTWFGPYTAATGLPRDGDETQWIKILMQRSAAASSTVRWMLAFCAWVEP